MPLRQGFWRILGMTVEFCGKVWYSESNENEGGSLMGLTWLAGVVSPATGEQFPVGAVMMVAVAAVALVVSAVFLRKK